MSNTHRSSNRFAPRIGNNKKGPGRKGKRGNKIREARQEKEAYLKFFTSMKPE